MKLKYDEHFRMDAARTDGTVSNLFHRTQIVLNKVQDKSDELLADFSFFGEWAVIYVHDFLNSMDYKILRILFKLLSIIKKNIRV